MSDSQNNLNSKVLSHADDSGFYFAQEMLDGDLTAAINFDRLQYHPTFGYIIFEYLLCEEHQYVTPWSSHPKRYWNKNSRKFLSLFKASKALNATLFLVNYAKKGTLHEDEILVIKVIDMDSTGIKKEELWKTNRSDFKEWFRKLNRESLS